MKKNKTQPKQALLHMQGRSHPEKGTCGKRGARTKHLEDVSCGDCRVLYMTSASPSTVSALHRMAGTH